VKICPNPSCPDALALGKPAQYEDRFDHCPQCGTELVTGNAERDDESEIQPEPVMTELRNENLGEQTALLASFESKEDVDLCVEECEMRDIPIMVIPSTGASDSKAEMHEATDAMQAFDVYVRQADLFRAMNVIMELFGDEADEETSESDGYEDWDVEPES
jgi:transcription elongation factor Elf1